MLNKKIFKAYDVRGLYPQDINIEAIAQITKALEKIWEPGLIVLAHDGRHGSLELAREMEKLLATSSQKIEFVGLTTTPMFYFLVNHFKASGGAMLTASHNPKEYTGVKAVTRGAESIQGTTLLKIIEQYGL